MYFAGVDVGSTMTKVVLVDKDGKILSRIIGPTGAEHRRLANKVTIEALDRANLKFDEVSYVIATGYGRMNVPFADRQITELTCHLKGILSIFPNAKTLVDIGGQDSKVIKIRNGRMVNYVMNDKCAAGTGRFLEILSEALGLRFDDLGDISLKAKNKIQISSICTVFAREEVIDKISHGTPLEDIVAGLHDAIATRVGNMVKRMRIEPDVVFTGGVAKNKGVVEALKDKLQCDILVPDNPLITGALGAAILGKEIMLNAINSGKTVQVKERRLDEITFF